MIEKKKIIISIIILLLLIIIIPLYFIYFTNIGLVIKCPIHSILHIYCPGCGLTRMIKSILELNFYQAFRYNPLLFILFPFILVLLIDKYINWLKSSKNYLYKRINPKVYNILLIIILIYFILRNIPMFKYLIPTVI